MCSLQVHPEKQRADSTIQTGANPTPSTTCCLDPFTPAERENFVVYLLKSFLFYFYLFHFRLVNRTLQEEVFSENCNNVYYDFEAGNGR